MYQIYKNGELKKSVYTKQQVADHCVCELKHVIVALNNKGIINGYKIITHKAGNCLTCGERVSRKGDQYCTPCYEMDLIGRSVDSYDSMSPKTGDEVIYPARGV